MKAIVVIAYFLIIINLNGCFLLGGKDNPSNPRYWEIEIIYTNAKGENLLNPKTMDHFNKDSIKIRFLGNPGGANMVVDTHSITGIFYGANDEKVEGVLQLNKTTYDTLTLLGDDELRRVLYDKKEIPLPSNIANSTNFFFTVIK